MEGFPLPLQWNCHITSVIATGSTEAAEGQRFHTVLRVTGSAKGNYWVLGVEFPDLIHCLNTTEACRGKQENTTIESAKDNLKNSWKNNVRHASSRPGHGSRAAGLAGRRAGTVRGTLLGRQGVRGSPQLCLKSLTGIVPPGSDKNPCGCGVSGHGLVVALAVMG